MKALKTLAVSALLMSAGCGAYAQTFDEDSKCEAVAAIIQDPSSTDQAVKEISGYIEQTMLAVDRLHGQRGKREIFPQLTEDGRSTLVQAVMVRCQSRQAITIADTAIETYEAFRATAPDPSSNKAAQKPVPARYSRTAAPRQPAHIKTADRRDPTAF